MKMNNKLFCHHKSKSSILMKEFSLTFLGVFTLMSTIAVPTYISTLSTQKIVTQASEEKENESNEKDAQNELEEDKDLLEYE